MPPCGGKIIYRHWSYCGSDHYKYPGTAIFLVYLRSCTIICLKSEIKYRKFHVLVAMVSYLGSHMELCPQRPIRQRTWRGISLIFTSAAHIKASDQRMPLLSGQSGAGWGRDVSRSTTALTVSYSTHSNHHINSCLHAYSISSQLTYVSCELIEKAY